MKKLSPRKPRPKMVPVPTVRPFVDNSPKIDDEKRLLSHPFFRSLDKLFK
jgi:hypothetical protein